MDVKQVEDPSKEVEELNKRLEASERRAAELSQTIETHEEALAWRSRQLKELERKLKERESELNAASTKLLGVVAYMEGLQDCFGWKLILRVRHFRDSLLPAGSLRRKFSEKIVGLVKHRA
jgi:hypothetical protein